MEDLAGEGKKAWGGGGREPADGREWGLDDKASGREDRAAGLDFVPRAVEAITVDGCGLV